MSARPVRPSITTLNRAVLARIEEVRGAMRWADGRSYPATLIGTVVPAVAGVVFAQRLAFRSVKELKRADLEAQGEMASLNSGSWSS